MYLNLHNVIYQIHLSKAGETSPSQSYHVHLGMGAALFLLLKELFIFQRMVRP